MRKNNFVNNDSRGSPNCLYDSYKLTAHFAHYIISVIFVETCSGEQSNSSFIWTAATKQISKTTIKRHA